jgi:hypothetical protein
MTRPLDVFITVDTEAWPRAADWRETRLRADMDRDFHGRTPEGDFGIRYQMEVLNRYGLKGVFFVESVFADVVGLDRLEEIVAAVRDMGHEVQLHAHAEWLAWMPRPLVPLRDGKHLKDFNEDEQTILLGRALENLRRAGAQDVCAFRAGNYGADFNTLSALSRIGIEFDTSYNIAYLDASCGLRTGSPLSQPARIRGVCEVPISFVVDRPGHYRHMQLVACSFHEMAAALWKAWKAGWKTFVIVSHSFELIRGRNRVERGVCSDPILVRRFDKLCAFLARHRDRFHTAGFAGLRGRTDLEDVESPILKSSLFLTAGRYAEQALRRLV